MHCQMSILIEVEDGRGVWRMNASDTFILNSFFTQNTLKNLLERQFEKTYSTSVRRFLKNPEIKTNQELINEIYSVMKKEYRNEYFYKNTILNKLLLGRHSPNTTTALTEVPIAKSKADFILINGRAIVYEIKTELDNFDRLEGQLRDYYKAFSRVCVVTCESNYNYILEKLHDTPVGICLLTNRNTLSTKKETLEDSSNLDVQMMFKILRKSEYESIIKDYYGQLPQVSQFKYYKACRQLFCDLEVNTAYRYLLRELKKRNKIDSVRYKNVPYELKFLVYFSGFRQTDYSQLERFLRNKFGG